MSEEFINTMYSVGLCPIITRPTRITAQSAILRDDIFTNETENKTVSGLIIDDIRDNLPTFAVYDSNYRKNKQEIKLNGLEHRNPWILSKVDY